MFNTIYVVDPNDREREHTATMLRTHRYDVSEWIDADAFIAVDDIRPGCVVIDLYARGVDGEAVQRRFADPKVGLPNVIVTACYDLDRAVTAMRMGAIDYLTKPCDATRLIDAIGVGVERLTKASKRAALMRRVTTVLDLLTPREREVLDRLTKGLSNKEIAIDLAISSRTVEIYRRRVMDKLNAESLSQALRIAFISEVCSMVNPGLHVG